MARILVVDDEQLILDSLAKSLKQCGHEVTTAADGANALQALSRSAFDICILDVRLSDSNGLDLMNFIGNFSPAARIIIMTADTLNDEQLDAIRAQGCHYVPKPFDFGHIRDLVDNVGV